MTSRVYHALTHMTTCHFWCSDIQRRTRAPYDVVCESGDSWLVGVELCPVVHLETSWFYKRFQSNVVPNTSQHFNSKILQAGDMLVLLIYFLLSVVKHHTDVLSRDRIIFSQSTFCGLLWSVIMTYVQIVVVSCHHLISEHYRVNRRDVGLIPDLHQRSDILIIAGCFSDSGW